MKGSPIQSATFERVTEAERWIQQTETAIREGRHFKTSEAKRHTKKVGKTWYEREESNLHALRHWLLKPACLPISPLSHKNRPL